MLKKNELLNKIVFFLTLLSNQAFSYFEYKPDYFKYINFPDSFQIKNENITVTVIDSEIANLKELNVINKEYFILNYQKSKDKDDPFHLHGTAMASIIGSKKFRGREESYIGIFPNVKIINRIAMPNGGYPLSILEAASEAIFSENEFIINISGADVGTKNANEWNDLLNKVGDKNKVLIIAAVGNDQRDIRTTQPDKQYWPAAYNPRNKKNKLNDPVIRVAAVSFENKLPELFITQRGTGSRYGKGRVDIGAPGYSIPFLTDDHEVKIANGTSESAAIVSGVIAIMKSCISDASASFIKSTLLETADSYEHLKEYITDGKILNAGKAIEKVCENEKEIIDVNINNDNHFKSKIIFKHDLNKNEYFENPVIWSIKISNYSYNHFFLTDLNGLNHYQSKFEVSPTDDNIQYSLSESGQIITKSGNRDSMPLCLTASDLNESSWQHIGFLPCSKSYENYQKWDLNFISEKTNSTDNFRMENLKLKDKDICLRMKNRHINWGELFLSHCNEYDDNSYLLKLSFVPNNRGFSKVPDLNYDYFYLKSGNKYVSPNHTNYASLYMETNFKFRFDPTSMRIIGFDLKSTERNKQKCLIKRDGITKFHSGNIENISDYTYLEIDDCSSKISPNEQFLLTSKETWNGKEQFAIYSDLESDNPLNLDKILIENYESDLTNPNKMLCTGVHHDYLWMGRCEKEVIKNWKDELYFYFDDK